MSEWRPIETAPRDGTRVLGAWQFAWSGDWCLMVVKWHQGAWVVPWDFDEVEPTHWAPLPQLPECRQ